MARVAGRATHAQDEQTSAALAHRGQAPSHVLNLAGIHLFEDGDGLGQKRSRKTAGSTLHGHGEGFCRYALQKVIQTCHALTPVINSDNRSVFSRWLR